MTILSSYLFRLLGGKDVYARYDHTYLNFGRLKQEDCKFLTSLGCLVKPCLQTEQNKMTIRFPFCYWVNRNHHGPRSSLARI